VYNYSAEAAPAPPHAVAAVAAGLFDDAEPAETSRPVGMHIVVPDDASRLSIDVWDRFGRHVRQLAHETQPPAGERIVEWDVSDDAREPLEPGYYIVRATADDRSESKMLWVTD
jgi:flagellar hook assembly protein FlgD